MSWQCQKNVLTQIDYMLYITTKTTFKKMKVLYLVEMKLRRREAAISKNFKKTFLTEHPLVIISWPPSSQRQKNWTKKWGWIISHKTSPILEWFRQLSWVQIDFCKKKGWGRVRWGKKQLSIVVVWKRCSESMQHIYEENQCRNAISIK